MPGRLLMLLYVLQAWLLARAQDALIGGSVGEGLSGASLSGAALQLLPLALTRASILFPRIVHVDEPGEEVIAVNFAGMGRRPMSAAAWQQLLPETLTIASALHPMTRRAYQAGRLVRLTRRLALSLVSWLHLRS